jgi:hypothetical protein
MSEDKKYYEYYIDNANQQIKISYILLTIILMTVCFIPFLIPLGLIIGIGLIMDILKQKNPKKGLSIIDE